MTMTTTIGIKRVARAGRPLSLTAAALLALALPASSQESAGDRGGAWTLTLERALTRAVSASPQLAAARFGLEEANEQVSEAWGNVFPTIDLTTSYTRNISPAVSFLPAIIFDPNANPDDQIAVQFGSDNAWSLAVNVEQPLFNAAAFIGVGAAGRFQALQSEGVRGQVQEVVTRVRSTYYQLLLNQEQVRLLENSIERVQQSLQETRALNEAGLSSDYDVLRLEVELGKLEPNRRGVRRSVQILA